MNAGISATELQGLEELITALSGNTPLYVPAIDEQIAHINAQQKSNVDDQTVSWLKDILKTSNTKVLLRSCLLPCSPADTNPMDRVAESLTQLSASCAGYPQCRQTRFYKTRLKQSIHLEFVPIHVWSHRHPPQVQPSSMHVNQRVGHL